MIILSNLNYVSECLLNKHKINLSYKDMFILYIKEPQKVLLNIKI